MPTEKEVMHKALKMACEELANLHGCPSEILHPDFEFKGDCNKNSYDGIDEAVCWENLFVNKAKEVINAEKERS